MYHARFEYDQNFWSMKEDMVPFLVVVHKL